MIIRQISNHCLPSPIIFAMTVKQVVHFITPLPSPFSTENQQLRRHSLIIISSGAVQQYRPTTRTLQPANTIAQRFLSPLLFLSALFASMAERSILVCCVFILWLRTWSLLSFKFGFLNVCNFKWGSLSFPVYRLGELVSQPTYNWTTPEYWRVKGNITLLHF